MLKSGLQCSSYANELYYTVWIAHSRVWIMYCRVGSMDYSVVHMQMSCTTQYNIDASFLFV